jgi:4'-phosphopantetheinyl transferase
MLDVYWLEQTEADVPVDNDWLSTNEATRLNGMRFAKRRADWRLGRWTAKRALAISLNMPSHREALAGIEIRPAESGAPEVYFTNQPAPVTISLSHRRGTAACAVAPSGVALGCDLEIIEPRSDGFIADYFAPEEQAIVAQESMADRPRLLALLWSGKESTLKALRKGLRLDTRCVIVSRVTAPLRQSEEDKDCASPLCGPNRWHRLHVRYTDGQIFQGWWQYTGDLLRTLVAAPPPAPPILLNRIQPSALMLPPDEYSSVS